MRMSHKKYEIIILTLDDERTNVITYIISIPAFVINDKNQ